MPGQIILVKIGATKDGKSWHPFGVVNNRLILLQDPFFGPQKLDHCYVDDWDFLDINNEDIYKEIYIPKEKNGQYLDVLVFFVGTHYIHQNHPPTFRLIGFGGMANINTRIFPYAFTNRVQRNNLFIPKKYFGYFSQPGMTFEEDTFLKSHDLEFLPNDFSRLFKWQNSDSFVVQTANQEDLGDFLFKIYRQYQAHLKRGSLPQDQIASIMGIIQKIHSILLLYFEIEPDPQKKSIHQIDHPITSEMFNTEIQANRETDSWVSEPKNTNDLGEQEESIISAFHNIDEIITKERKLSTYHFALLRGIIDICLQEHEKRIEEGGYVFLPIHYLIEKWIHYYYPFIASDKFIPQAIGEQISHPILEFRSELKEFYLTIDKFGLSYDEFEKKMHSEDLNPEFEVPLYRLYQAIYRTITDHSMRLFGHSLFNQEYSIFDYDHDIRHPTETPSLIHYDILKETFGLFFMKKVYYDTFREFGGYLTGETSIINHWAQFTRNLDDSMPEENIIRILLN